MNDWLTSGTLLLLAVCVVIMEQRLQEVERDMERMRTIYKDSITADRTEVS